MPYAAMSDGVRLNHQVNGRDGGPTVLLSHSIGTDLNLWSAQAAALEDRFRVIRYDIRGHGQSDVPSGPYAMERLGRDVLELLDHLAVERTDFCGISMGGGVGQWLGANAPDRIGKLVLANTTAVFGTPAIWQGRLDLALSQGMAALADGTVERWFTPQFRQSAPGTRWPPPRSCWWPANPRAMRDAARP